MGKLLIIDDGAPAREELIDILTADGDLEVFPQAHDGASGLKVLSDPEQAVGVVCCDLDMPLMDGYQFLRIARANPDLMSVPVVMVTTESDVNDVVKAFELGATIPYPNHPSPPSSEAACITCFTLSISRTKVHGRNRVEKPSALVE
jgi:DNA-binding NarL/FixJ family response regulator